MAIGFEYHIFFKHIQPIERRRIFTVSKGDVFKLTIRYDEVVIEGEASVLNLISESEGLNTNAIAERINKSISTTERYYTYLCCDSKVFFVGILRC